MELLTRQDLARSAAKRWRMQYQIGPNGEWRSTISGDTECRYVAMKALADPTPEQIDSIIGNDSWTTLSCDECREDCESVIVFSRYEHSQYMCAKCLNKAARLIDPCSK